MARLMTYRRGTDADFCRWFLRARDLPLQQGVEEALLRYPRKNADADVTIVISHRRRRWVNRTKQARLARSEETVAIPECGDEPGYPCFVGTRLIGANSDFTSVVNGARLLVTAISPRLLVRDEETGRVVSMTAVQLSRHTRLRHAITLASCQGRTLQGTVCLADIHSKHLTPAVLYVAASRATSGHLFQVCP